MDNQPTSIRYNLPKLLLVLALLVVIAFDGTISLASHDLLWFVPGFSTRPVRMVLYSKGKQTVFQQGQVGYDVLADAVVQSLASGISRQSGLGLSTDSLQDAYKVDITLEVFFDHPVKLHAWFDTDAPTQMLFPLTGRHADVAVVFLGNGSLYISNSPVLKSIEPIRQTLTSLGYPNTLY